MPLNMSCQVKCLKHILNQTETNSVSRLPVPQCRSKLFIGHKLQLAIHSFPAPPDRALDRLNDNAYGVMFGHEHSTIPPKYLLLALTMRNIILTRLVIRQEPTTAITSTK